MGTDPAKGPEGVYSASGASGVPATRLRNSRFVPIFVSLQERDSLWLRLVLAGGIAWGLSGVGVFQGNIQGFGGLRIVRIFFEHLMQLGNSFVPAAQAAQSQSHIPPEDRLPWVQLYCIAILLQGAAQISTLLKLHTRIIRLRRGELIPGGCEPGPYGCGKLLLTGVGFLGFPRFCEGPAKLVQKQAREDRKINFISA